MATNSSVLQLCSGSPSPWGVLLHVASWVWARVEQRALRRILPEPLKPKKLRQILLTCFRLFYVWFQLSVGVTPAVLLLSPLSVGLSLITKRAHQSQSVCFSVLIQGEMQLMCLFVLRSDGHTSPVTSGVEIKHPNIIYARAENHHEQQLLLFGLRDTFLEYLPDPVEDVRLFSCWLHQRVS